MEAVTTTSFKPTKPTKPTPELALYMKELDCKIRHLVMMKYPTREDIRDRQAYISEYYRRKEK